MYVPQKNIEDFSLDLIEKCRASRQERLQRAALYRQYYFSGSGDGTQAKYNLCYPHIDRTSSYLFSPSDVNFRVHFSSGEYSRNVPKDWLETFGKMFSLRKKQPQQLKWNDWQEMGKIAAHYLNYEFGRCEVDTKFAAALDWALIKGCAFLRVLWGGDGFEPYVWQSEMMGVLREDVNGLDRQEAFTATSYITMDQLRQRLRWHPQEQELLKKIKRRAKNSQVKEQFESDFLHQIVIGGIATQANPSGNIKASAQIFGTPVPKVSPRVVQDLLICHELFVQDDDREDWTTIQLVEPDIVIEGKLRRRNISGIKGDTGFHQICANPVEGYFWGMSELEALYPLQDKMNTRQRQADRVLRKRTRPSGALTGYSGDAENAKRVLDGPDGLLVEQTPGAKFDKIQPDAPKEIYEDMDRTKQQFDDVSGFQPIVRGEGEAGVRSGVHAETLVRTASPRMRDRAILVEKQCSGVGDYCFKMLQAKETRAFVTQAGDEFLLAQLPDDIRVYVDSHSSSPAFSEDNRQMAYQLAKFGAIDHESLLEIVHPPNEDVLIQRARQKAESEAKLLAEHPELLTKGKRH